MKKSFQDVKIKLRVAFRAARLVTLLLGATVLAGVQKYVMGPVFKNHTLIPKFIYGQLRKVFGLKVVFNKASEPLVQDKTKAVWWLPNHSAPMDFAGLGGILNSTFCIADDFKNSAFMSYMLSAGRCIALRRSRDANEQSKGKLIKNFNEGFNNIMFPEGTVGEGDVVYLFRAALPELLYSRKGLDENNKEITLQKDVVVQPIAIRVIEANGQNAIGNKDLRNLYCMPDAKGPVDAFKRMLRNNITLELTAFKPLDPKDFPNAEALMNKCALDIASVVNPGQTTFEKKKIPGKEEKSAAPAA